MLCTSLTAPLVGAPRQKQRPPARDQKIEDIKKNMEFMFINDEIYQVLKVLGKGGSACVYQAIDSKGNIRAIKKVIGNLSASACLCVM